MSILNNSLLLGADAAAGGYSIPRSLRFNSSDSAYLSRTPASAGNRKTFTLAFWMKKSGLTTFQSLFNSYTDANNRTAINFDSSIGSGGAGDYLTMFTVASGATTSIFQTNAIYRDPSSWYHFVIAVDTTQATSTNRVKLWVNGVLATFSTYNAPSQNADLHWNSASTHYFGVYGGSPGTTSYGFNGYLADAYHLDGVAVSDATTFGAFDATTGVWNPIAYSGSYGTNGFHLPFSDNSAATATTLGKDTSGNGNNFTPSNLSVTAGAGNDSLVDSPTNGTASGGGDAGGTVVGNYATLNPLNTGATSLANGNLEVTTPSAGYGLTYATIGVSTGKWYWEVTPTTITGNSEIGIAKAGGTLTNALGSYGSGYSYVNSALKGNGNSYVSYGVTYTTNDVIGVALDLDAGTVVFYKNGSSQGTAYSSLSGEFFPAISDSSNSGGSVFVSNFGARPFAYAAPSGFKSLNTANLPTPTILAGNTAFDTKLYTGNGGSQSISGLAFSPDLVWIKRRDAVGNHAWFDVVRSATKFLVSSSTAAEGTDANSLTAFTSDGFTVNDPVTTSPTINGSSQTYAAWCWDAGSSTVTNTAGSITSTVRANASAGFSVVTFTGTGANATIGHGGLANLSDGMIIVKNRSSATNWRVYHSALGNTKVIFLSTTGTPDTNSVYWNNTSPTSTVFSVGSDDGVNGNGNSMVAYCFAPVSGYSSFGSITANGSTDGPFAYLGFRPRFLLYKNASAVGNWGMYDSSRDPENVCDNLLLASSSGAEFTSVEFDFLSNGIKLRYAYTNNNQIVFAAFAENPFSIARAR